jgi:hypothetical protein
MFDHLRVDEDTHKQRLSLCDSCEHNKFNVCKKCGCLIKLKTQWAGASCPIKKWESVPTKKL